ncbi:unnamed protein product, partial [Discosporangium mesarthrocarpum]
MSWMVAESSSSSDIRVVENAEEEIERLQELLEEKGAALRSAAVIGKMLLDEKEEDADAHEAEKEALWRRIQEMARRVMELEREASEREERRRSSFSSG